MSKFLSWVLHTRLGYITYMIIFCIGGVFVFHLFHPLSLGIWIFAIVNTTLVTLYGLFIEKKNFRNKKKKKKKYIWKRHKKNISLYQQKG